MGDAADGAVALDDPHDARLDEFRDLRGRESSSLMWAEGATVVERLLASPHRTRAVLLTPRAAERLAPLATASGAAVLVAERDVVHAALGFDLHRGAIAVADRPGPVELADALAASRTVVAAEGITDAVNLGAIARSARALGAGSLVLDPTCTDPWYRRTIRVSMGEILHLPVVRSRSWPGPLDDAVRAGYEVWALTPDPRCR